MPDSALRSWAELRGLCHFGVAIDIVLAEPGGRTTDKTCPLPLCAAGESVRGNRNFGSCQTSWLRGPNCERPFHNSSNFRYLLHKAAGDATDMWVNPEVVVRTRRAET